MRHTKDICSYRFRLRVAFTLVELLVVIAIIGILIGMLLPAVSQVREAANRAYCSNNLRQMATACHNYQSSFQRYPEGAVIGQGASWSAHILPQLDQAPMASRLLLEGTSEGCTNADRNRRGISGGSGGHWASPDDDANEQACETFLPVFRCPSDPVAEFIPSGGIAADRIEERIPCSYLGSATSATINQNELIAVSYTHLTLPTKA